MSLAEKVCKALAVGGLYAPADIEQRIASGHMQEWTEAETVVITAVFEHPLAKVCKTIMVAGDFDTAWKIHDEQIVPWARSIGCTRMVGEGRKGWAESARKHGYTTQWLTAAMEL